MFLGKPYANRKRGNMKGIQMQTLRKSLRYKPNIQKKMSCHEKTAKWTGRHMWRDNRTISKVNKTRPRERRLTRQKRWLDRVKGSPESSR